MNRVYLAGPDVFLPNPKEHAEDLKRICQEFQLEGVFPLDAELSLEGVSPGVRAQRIFDANLTLIRSCQGVLANMTPFRGPSMDVGTAWEMGFAHALGLPIVGYTSSRHLYRDRVLQYRAYAPRESAKEVPERSYFDPESISLPKQPFFDPEFIEDFGLNDNLMLDCSARIVDATFREAAERLATILGSP